MAKTVEPPVTDDDIEQAQAALAQGNAELTRLHEAFLDGREGVEWKQVQSQKAVVEFAEVSIERLARQKSRYETQQRLDAANRLHDEINAHALGIGGKLAEQARTYFEARRAFLDAAAAHNATVSDFTERAKALDVPRSNGRPVGFARDGRLQLPQNGDGIHAGRRRLSAIDGPQYLERIDTNGDIDGVVASLSLIDAELPEPVEGTVHYRGSGGAVFAYSPENVPTAEEIKRGGLVKVTAAEAWGDDDE